MKKVIYATSLEYRNALKSNNESHHCMHDMSHVQEKKCSSQESMRESFEMFKNIP